MEHYIEPEKFSFSVFLQIILKSFRDSIKDTVSFHVNNFHLFEVDFTEIMLHRIFTNFQL